MKKFIYLYIALTGFSNLMHAQEDEVRSMPSNMLFVGYEVSIPTNNDYLSETSWAGFRLDYRHMVTPNVSVGLAMSFNTFEEYFDRRTYTSADGSTAVTSDMIRQIYTTPITASVHYYFNGDMITPYVGVGLGAQYSEQDAYFNIYGVTSNNWGFVTRPEVGIMGRFSSSVGGYLSVAYNYATNKNDAFDIDNLTHIPITLGLVFNP